MIANQNKKHNKFYSQGVPQSFPRWEGGARKRNVLRKIRQPKRGRGGRGVWGEFRHARAGTSARLRLPVRAERRKQNFLFLLEEKVVARKKRIVKKILLEA